jgi:hypothetical protein
MSCSYYYYIVQSTYQVQNGYDSGVGYSDEHCWMIQLPFDIEESVLHLNKDTFMFKISGKDIIIFITPLLFSVRVCSRRFLIG